MLQPSEVLNELDLCKYTYYKNKKGQNRCIILPMDELSACCAIGAIYLTFVTEPGQNAVVAALASYLGFYEEYDDHVTKFGIMRKKIIDWSDSSTKEQVQAAFKAIGH